jgi:adhesin transport system outer membrane protein
MIDRAGLVKLRSMTNLEAVRQNVLLRGISAYLNIVMAREKLRYARQSEENIRTQTGMEETLVSKGAGLSSDILQTKSQLARARALRVSVEGELIQAINFFKAIYGFVPTEAEISGFRLPVDPASLLPDGVEVMVKRALENNPDIRITTLEGAIAVQEEKINRARYLPRINLFAKDIRREDDLGVEGIREERSFGIELTANLFRGGSDCAAVQASVEKNNALQSQLSDTRMVVEGKVRNAWQDLQTSREKHKYLRNQADIIEEFLVLARKERKLGTRSLIDVLTGEVDQINAESQAVTSEIETLLASFNLYYAMGDLTADVVRVR